jgi:hypothetical protein
MLPEAGGGSDGVGDPVAEQCRLLQQLAHPRAAATWQSSFDYFSSETLEPNKYGTDFFFFLQKYRSTNNLR